MINNITTKKGLALPIGNDYYLMIGKNPNKTDDIDTDVKLKNCIAKLSVDNGKIDKKDKNNNEVRVFSAQKFLGGESPANLVLKGANPNLIFAAQEQYKQINGINDDGSKKKAKFGIKEFVKKLFGGNSNKSPLEGENNYLEDVASRQAYAESKYDTTSTNSKNARGLFQIRPIGVDEYNRQTGDSISYESVLNTDTAIMVRNKLMDGYMNRPWINNPNNENDTVTTIKALMAYNMGDSNALQILNKLKSNGVNIYNAESLLKNIPINETKNYSSFIATGENQKDKLYLNNMLYNTFKNKNKDLDEKIRNSQRTKKQYGGMTNKEKNASLLGYVPSTGKQYQSNNRKRALWGTDGKWYERKEDMPIGVTPIIATDFKYNINPETGLLEPKSYKIGDKTVDKVKSPYRVIENPKPEDKLTENNIPAKKKSIREKLTDKYGPQGAGYFLGNVILHGASALTGLAGASANVLSNAHYLNKMKSIVDSIKSYDIPLISLKTRFNINPQLSENRRNLGLTLRDIDANTASSQVALARKHGARYNTALQNMKLYGQKENIETNLINQNLLQQGQTIAKNIQNAQNVEHQKAMLNMQLLDKRSENETKMLETYAGIVNQFANAGGNTIYNWLRYKAALAGNPNSVEAMSHV